MKRYKREEVCLIATKLGLPEIPISWEGIDYVVPILEKIKNEGGVIIIKFDGERNAKEDNGSYTIMMSDSKISDGFFRIDSTSLEDGLAEVIVMYADQVWGMKREH